MASVLGVTCLVKCTAPHTTLRPPRMPNCAASVHPSPYMRERGLPIAITRRHGLGWLPDNFWHTRTDTLHHSRT